MTEVLLRVRSDNQASGGLVAMGEIVVAVKAAILDNRRMLIIRRADNDETGSGTWEIAGGKLEFGEALEQSLAREVKEEVGIDITVERLLYATTFKTNLRRQVVILSYLCRGQQKDIVLPDEHSEYLWASRLDLEKHLPPEILLDLEKSGVLSLDELE